MNRRMLGAAGLAFALTACASNKPTIKSDVSPSANFGSYSSYSWISSSVPQGMDPVIGQRIRDSVDGAMAAKGYTKVDPPNGQLSLGFTVGARGKTDLSGYATYGEGVDINQIAEGHVAVNAFDTKTSQPVWHGYATQRINPKGDPANVSGVVTQVMQSFPPAGVSSPGTPQK